MSVLAWLMLVVTSLAAAPLEAPCAHPHAVHATAAAVGEPSHHGMEHRASHDCCQDHAGCCGANHACGCAGMCASVLLPVPAGVTAATALAAIYALPLRVHAPSVDSAPPLRPPSIPLSLV